MSLQPPAAAGGWQQQAKREIGGRGREREGMWGTETNEPGPFFMSQWAFLIFITKKRGKKVPRP